MTTPLHQLCSAAIVAVAGALLPMATLNAATGPAASASAPTKSVQAARVASAARTGTAKARHKGKTIAAAPKQPVRPVELVLPEATPEQADAAGRVYYGVYDCEFKQTISIDADPKFPSYVDVHHGKLVYIMKPVLSSTGAIRLEDVMADTLMVQISSKSMLLNVNTGHRLVDDCISPGQRAAIEATRLAKLQADVDAAAAAASGADGAPPTPDASHGAN